MRAVRKRHYDYGNKEEVSGSLPKNKRFKYKLVEPAPLSPSLSLNISIDMTKLQALPTRQVVPVIPSLSLKVVIDMTKLPALLTRQVAPVIPLTSDSDSSDESESQSSNSSDESERSDMDGSFSLSTQNSPSPWKIGINTKDPLFTDKKGFIEYCKTQLDESDQEEYTKCIEEIGCSENSALTKIRDRCQMGEPDAQKAYAVYIFATHSESPFTNAGRFVGKATENASYIPADTVKGWFFKGTVEETYALSTIFNSHVTALKKMANQNDDQGRNATYWLIKALTDHRKKAADVAHELNRHPAVDCPFGSKWSSVHIKVILGCTVDDLIKDLKHASHQNAEPSRALFLMANNGDDYALSEFIKYYRDTKKISYSRIAQKLNNHVKIPTYGENKRWRAHMVEQYLLSQPITLDVSPDYERDTRTPKNQTRTSSSSKCRQERVLQPTTATHGKSRKKKLSQKPITPYNDTSSDYSSTDSDHSSSGSSSGSGSSSSSGSSSGSSSSGSSSE
ncbi:hypothetical protein [Parendozoicomonas sp. Alg238-R29]|uniref:hypothetical protein n=1 Tax=Parendozoicomonas sp. Alg238-R29 TaxID=2993446 RepID=UPI00248E6AEC|nr:hypothetical protein [Parendozoicomonas sp. Alg238-R29]